MFYVKKLTFMVWTYLGDFSGFRGKEIGNEKLIAILDLQQIGYKNVDARGLITGFQFLQVSSPTTVMFIWTMQIILWYVYVLIVTL